VQWRFKEHERRGDWAGALWGTVGNYRTVAEEPGERYSHISADSLALIAQHCDEAERWLKDLERKQAEMPKYEKPSLLCADIERKNGDLARLADEILKEPKPVVKHSSAPTDDEVVVVDEKATGDNMHEPADASLVAEDAVPATCAAEPHASSGVATEEAQQEKVPVADGPLAAAPSEDELRSMDVD